MISLPLPREKCLTHPPTQALGGGKRVEHHEGQSRCNQGCTHLLSCMLSLLYENDYLCSPPNPNAIHCRARCLTSRAAGPSRRRSDLAGHHSRAGGEERLEPSSVLPQGMDRAESLRIESFRCTAHFIWLYFPCRSMLLQGLPGFPAKSRVIWMLYLTLGTLSPKR